MTEPNERIYDLIVIGAGPGGYEAALHAAGLGLSTAIVESRQLGGTCLNRGCIPTKTLLHAAELYEQTKKMGLFGLSADNVYFDVEKMHERKDEVLDKLRGGIAMRLKKAKVDVYEGKAQVKAPSLISVRPARRMESVKKNGISADTGTVLLLHTKKTLIAAGASPQKPPIPGADARNVYTSDELLEERSRVFQRTIIIGGGVIGCEFATIYNSLGTQVVILEAENRILPLMDKEISQSLSMSLKKKGVEIHTGVVVSKIVEGESEGRLNCLYKEKDKVEKVGGDCVLISIGRVPNTEKLFADGLTRTECKCEKDVGKQYNKIEKKETETQEDKLKSGGVVSNGDAKVILNRGFIQVDKSFETGMPGIYAIGDVIGGTQLAHVAAAEGIVAVENIAGVKPSKNLELIPSCIYTNPEIASVGLTADEAKHRSIAVRSSKFSMMANGKSVIEEQERGFIKVISRKEGEEVVGAQLMCARATDLITELSVAISGGFTIEQLNSIIHPHPTFSEGIGEAVKG